MKLGFFDSGIGGLTVLNEALKLLPDEEYIYYADTKNVPYGNKPKELIKEYVFDAVRFFKDQKVDALVLACNTATSVAIDELREEFNFPIIGMEPAVKPAVNNTSDKRVLVFATELTLKENRFKNLVAKVDVNNIVDCIPLQELVRNAEDFDFDENKIINYLRSKIKEIAIENYGTIVLGCTHFPYFKEMIRKVVPEEIQIIDGNKGTAKNLKSKVEHLPSSGKRSIEYYTSGVKANKEIFEKYFDLIRKIEAPTSHPDE